MDSGTTGQNIIGTYAIVVKRETAIRGQAQPSAEPFGRIGAVVGMLGRFDAIEKTPVDHGPASGGDRSEQDASTFVPADGVFLLCSGALLVLIWLLAGGPDWGVHS